MSRHVPRHDQQLSLGWVGERASYFCSHQFNGFSGGIARDDNKILQVKAIYPSSSMRCEIRITGEYWVIGVFLGAQ